MGPLLLALLLQDIDGAVRKGLDVVKASGRSELALWTLVRCDVPHTNPVVRDLLGETLTRR